QDEGRQLPAEGGGLLREDPDRRHARRVPSAARGAPAAYRPRPPGHRVRLWRHAAPRGRGQYATLRRSRHAVAPARWRIRGSGAGGRGSARRAIRGDLRAGLMMQAAIGIHTTDPIHRPIESPGALTRWARGLIMDERDLPFLSLIAAASVVMIPFAATLFIPGLFRW